MPSWDLVVTIGLLVFGVINVTQTVAVARDLRPMLGALFEQQGLADYSNDEAARIAGWLVIGINVLSLVLAIGFAVPRLRTRRVAFWVPLAAGVVCLVLTTAVVLAAAASDPAFVERLMTPSPLPT